MRQQIWNNKSLKQKSCITKTILRPNYSKPITINCSQPSTTNWNQPSSTIKGTYYKFRKCQKLNLSLFYQHEDKKSHLIPFIRKYWLVNIWYIHDIKKDKFKLKNIMILSISIIYIRKIAKSLKIGTNNLEIEDKEKDYIIINVKIIILFLQVFYVYTQIFIFLVAPSNKL